MIDLLERTWSTFGLPGIIGLSLVVSYVAILAVLTLSMSDD